MLLLLSACTAPPAAPTAHPAAITSTDDDRVPFSADLRAAELRTLASIIAEGYAHLEAKQAEWGVDLPTLEARFEPAVRAADTWRRYERVMVAFVSELHDGHLSWRRSRGPGESRRSLARLGLSSRFLGGGLRVTEVWPGSAVERAGVQVGDQVVAIDGQPVEQRFADFAAVRAWSRQAAARHDFGDEWPAAHYPAGSRPPARELQVVDAGGAARVLRLLPETRAPPGRSRRPPIELERRGGLTWLVVRSLRELVQPARLDELGAQLFVGEEGPGSSSAVGGLVIDLRGDSGGFEHLSRELAGRLTAHEVVGARLRVKLSARARSEHLEWRQLDEDPAMPGWSTLQPVVAPGRAATDYPGRIAVLIDAGCRSSCETLALLLRALGARLFGATTGGSSGAPITYVLPWSKARLQVPAWELFDLAGQRIEGRGLDPHESIEPTVDDLRAARDPVRLRAEAWARDGR